MRCGHWVSLSFLIALDLRCLSLVDSLCIACASKAFLYPFHLFVESSYFPSKVINYEIKIYTRTIDHCHVFGETHAFTQILEVNILPNLHIYANSKMIFVVSLFHDLKQLNHHT
jgi:hypothetical protein